MWQHQWQQQQLENINKQQQHINQFTSPTPTPDISETLSGNAFDQTEENGFDQQYVDKKGNNFISDSYSLLE